MLKKFFRNCSVAAERRPMAVALIALAAVLAILFHESLFLGKGLVPADGVFMVPPWKTSTSPEPSNYLLGDQYLVFLPQHEFVFQELHRGNFPLWNPRSGCGMPNIGSIQGSLLFPIQLLLSPIDPFYAAGIGAFLKLFLAGWFTILYLRRLGASHAAALLSGIAFAMSGFMIVWLGHPQLNSAMWLPLLLYFLEGQFADFPPSEQISRTTVSIRRWAGFALAFGCTILGGHPPTAIHIVIFITVYFIFRLISAPDQPKVKTSLLFMGAIGAGCLLAAPQILPYLEYYSESSSAISSAGLNRWSTVLSPNNLIHYFLPKLSGSPVDGFEDLPELLGLSHITNFNERTGYVGLAPLVLLPFAFFRRSRWTYYFGGTVAASLFIILGVPPIPSIVQFIPILRDINHTRLLLVTGFSLAVLAGFGLDALRSLEKKTKLVVLGVPWGIFIAGGLWFFGSRWAEISLLDAQHRMYLLREICIPAAGIILSALFLLPSIPSRHRMIGMLAVAWTAADLLFVFTGYNPSISRDRYYPVTGAIKYLQGDHSVFRIAGFGGILIPNTSQCYGLDDIRGCDYTSVKRYEELITGRAGDFFFYNTARYLPPVFPLLNVKYVLLPAPIKADTSMFELVYANEIAVYRFRQEIPRAIVVHDYTVEQNPRIALADVIERRFDPRKTVLLEEPPEGFPAASSGPTMLASADFTSYAPDDITIETNASRPGFLVLFDTYFPGWHAAVNGRDAKLYRADYNFRAVRLDAGRSVIRFHYRPPGLIPGFILSICTLLLLVAAWHRDRLTERFRSAFVSRHGS